MFNLLQKNKVFIKKIIPDFWVESSKSIQAFLKQKQINQMRAFYEKQPQPLTPVWLDRQHWELLHPNYPSLSGHIENYLQTSTARSRKNAQQILTFLAQQNTASIHQCLELGCGDGMVSYFLQNSGKKATAIDQDATSFDKRAIAENVSFFEMDASQLNFDDNQFDCVFSFNGFEHFAKPDLVLKEAIRVVKNGGYIYLNFAPLYFSPFGLHAWELINIPYAHLLFSPSLLQEILGEKSHSFLAETTNFLNGWSWQQFTNLWHQYSQELTICTYQENYNLNYLDLIKKYPSVFKSKTQEFEDLVCETIIILFKKPIKMTD